MPTDWAYYPWSTTSAATTIQWQYSGNTSYGAVPMYYPPAPTPVPDMPEGPMEWLKRRVTEITDLAYAA